MKIYKGMGKQGGPCSIFVHEEGKEYTASPLKHIVRHSPDGFQWGYGGSGPSDTALSILTDCVGKEKAERFYQDFKWDFIAKIKGNLEIYETSIRAWVEKAEALLSGYVN